MPHAVQRLLSPALLALAISGGAALASFLATALIARVSGPVVVGQFGLAMATANTLALLAILGLDRVLMREIAGDLRQGHAGRARHLLRRTLILVLPLSLALGLAYAGIILWLDARSALPGDRGAMLIVSLSLVAIPMLRLAMGTLRGAGMRLRGQLAEGGPSLLLIVFMLLLWRRGGAIDATTAVALFVLSQAFVALFAWWGLRRAVTGWGAPEPHATIRLWSVGLPFMANMLLQTFALWFLMLYLEGFATPQDVGVFRVVSQLITIAAVVIATAESWVAPQLAGDLRAGRTDLAWARYRRGLLMMATLAGPPLLLFALLPGQTLGLLFGQAFTGGATALVIMSLAQLATVLMGPVGSMLAMTGHEQVQLRLSVLATVLLVVLAVALVPSMGVTGAAIAYAATLLIRYPLGLVMLRRLLPANPGR